ncbi:hypothetical protein C2845_PM06G35620 [Panicum miliaceum]|uniref:Uncharacterized protein n=1 Tax=Panicum miliaceum TaxID=4540 RepID=A0A3L6RE19_PANMI|nr:hypothetical protein C2845_PM06G35620 [Panicum miliaceum]
MKIIVADGAASGAADWAAAAEGIADRASVVGVVADGDAIGSLKQVASEVAGGGGWRSRGLGRRRTVVRWKEMLGLWGRVGGECQYLRINWEGKGKDGILAAPSTRIPEERSFRALGPRKLQSLCGRPRNERRFLLRPFRREGLKKEFRRKSYVLLRNWGACVDARF